MNIFVKKTAYFVVSNKLIVIQYRLNIHYFQSDVLKVRSYNSILLKGNVSAAV